MVYHKFQGVLVKFIYVSLFVFANLQAQKSTPPEVGHFFDALKYVLSTLVLTSYLFIFLVLGVRVT